MELYRRRVWTDAKTVNVMASACFSRHSGVLRTALQFFVGSEKEQEAEASSESEDDDAPVQMVS